MADEPKAVYWDTDVIIHRLQRTPEHIDILEYLTDAAERNELLIVVSTFTIAEVVRAENLPPLTEDEDKLISDYFENDYIVVRPLTIPIAKLAREVARKYGIKPNDAVHVATAIFWKVPILHSYDKKLCNKTDMIGNPPLKIENPTYIDQMPLFAPQSASADQSAPIESEAALGDTEAPDAAEDTESVEDQELKPPTDEETPEETTD